MFAAAAAKPPQSCRTLCDSIDGSPIGSPIPEFLQARTLKVFLKVKSEREVAQSCPTLSDPMDCSLPGSSAHGIFQARVLEWGAIASVYWVLIHTKHLIGRKVGCRDDSGLSFPRSLSISLEWGSGSLVYPNL